MKLGRYEVVRELGKGAMGIVYLAKDPLIGRLVALKTIRPAAGSDDDETREFQQRFMREAQAAGILNHPSIVTVHDIGQDEPTGVSFIAMEYVEGHNLKEVLAQGKPLSFEQIADVIAQVADALDFAHSKGIVHRDVKPANIILIDGTRAKITDFGIAKIASGGGANLTTTGQFLGTPNYMAPEQVKGTPVDGRTDLFSLGICLYECLTRRKPFGGDSLTSISYKIVHEPFPPLHEVNPQIPDAFGDVVARCLAKEPGKRYQRGRDLAASLRAVIRGEHVPIAEPTGAEETVLTREFEPPPVERDEDVKIPTLEIPFPEADSEATPTRPRPAVSPAVPPAPLPMTEGAPDAVLTEETAKGPRVPVREQLRRTFSGVKTAGIWKSRIPPGAFFGVVGLLVAAFIVGVLIIQSLHPEAAAVDLQAERRAARQRQLRSEINELVQQGRVFEAYPRLTELRALSPNSPYVGSLLQRVEAIRQREELSRHQLAAAEQKLQQGIALFNQKKYPEAIVLLEESFHINPSSDDAAKYLKAAQIEEEKQRAQLLAQQQAKARASTQKATAARPPAPAPTPSSAPAGDGGKPASTEPAQITTFFRSPVADGHILVKAGTQVVAHENLWEERGRVFRRRMPRVVNVTKAIQPVNTDLEVWVVIPSLKIQEKKVFPQNFLPGANHRLAVTLDPKSKKLDIQFN